MRILRIAVIFAIVITVALFAASSVRATVALSNAPFQYLGPGLCVGTNLDDSDMLVAVGFQTDAGGTYNLDSVSSEWIVNHTSDITLTLYTDGGGIPGTAIATISTVPVTVVSDYVVLTLTHGAGALIELDPSTTYWFVASSPSPELWCPASWAQNLNTPTGSFTYVRTLQFFEGSWQEKADPLWGIIPVSVEINVTAVGGTTPGNSGQASDNANTQACNDNPGKASEHRPTNPPPCSGN